MHPQKKIAHMAGFAYLLLMPLSIIGIIYVPLTLFVEGDIATTIQNITDNQTLFRIGSVAAFLTQLMGLVLVYLLYHLFKGVDRNVAVIMVALMCCSVPVGLLIELNFVATLHLINDENPSSTLISLFLELRAYGINIAQIFWGLWLLPMGYLVYKSKFMPKIIGVMLAIGCFSYFLDSFIYFINPEFGFSFSEYLFVGEIAIMLWLLIMGIKIPDSQALNQTN